MRKKNRGKEKRKKSDRETKSEEKIPEEDEATDMNFGGNIDLDGLVKKGDSTLGGFISLKAKKFMECFNPKKAYFGGYLDFDSLGAYGIGDIFARLGLYVFLKEKFSRYAKFVEKFYANMQWSKKKLEIYCLVDGNKFFSHSYFD